jgi:hypothetical protein
MEFSRAMKIARKWSAFALVMILAGCKENDNGTYTLYRNSFVEGYPKVHTASFDSSDGKYNRNTCDLGRELFQKNFKPEPGGNKIRTFYWCEKGRYQESGLFIVHRPRTLFLEKLKNIFSIIVQ